MERFIIEKAAELGISDKVLFTGFLRGDDIDKAYQMADLYVMPSVSEPFGITPLEAMRNNTPVIISKQSGVSEVVNHCLKVDFWDMNEMVNKIIGVLKYPELKECLQENGAQEVKKFDWNIPAKKCIDVYEKVLRGGNHS
jgi:glycosyltransferase involved in cell wall biosynthesis